METKPVNCECCGELCGEDVFKSVDGTESLCQACYETEREID